MEASPEHPATFPHGIPFGEPPETGGARGICKAPSLYLGLGELLPQLLHLLAELADDAGVGVLVDHGVVDDVLGPVRVAQRRQRLVVVVGRRAHRGHHGRLAVAPEAVLEGWGMFRINTFISVCWRLNIKSLRSASQEKVVIFNARFRKRV